MDRLFTFLQTYRSGILLLLFALFCIALLVQWFAWIFNKGRFGISATSGKAVSYIFSEAAVKIINDFRHLLALIVVVIFAFALGYSLIKASSVTTGPDTSVINNMKEALQAVVATLGGLVGSIIGYYFGESSITKPAAQPTDAGVAKTTPEIQEPPKTKPAEPIKPAPEPPAQPGSDSQG
jgi:Mn2+/Fe2+ NRAMP family transporter